MSDKPHNQNDDTGSFVSRWSKRKLQHQSRITEQAPEQKMPPEQSTIDPIKEEDLPPIQSLHEDSEISMFLGEGISENLRRQALRRLFHFGKFNVCDGLDDYDEDYTIFEPLSDLIDVKQQLQRVTSKPDAAETEPQMSQDQLTPEIDDNNEQVPTLADTENDDVPEKG